MEDLEKQLREINDYRDEYYPQGSDASAKYGLRYDHLTKRRKRYPSLQLSLLNLLTWRQTWESDERFPHGYNLTNNTLAEMQDSFADLLAEVSLDEHTDLHTPISPEVSERFCSFKYIEGFPYRHTGLPPKSPAEILKARSGVIDFFTNMKLKGVDITFGMSEMDKRLYRDFASLIPGLELGEEEDRFIGENMEDAIIDHCVFLGSFSMGGNRRASISDSAIGGHSALAESQEVSTRNTVINGTRALSNSYGVRLENSLVNGRWALNKSRNLTFIGGIINGESALDRSSDSVLVGANIYAERLSYLKNCVFVNCNGTYNIDSTSSNVLVVNGVHPELIPSLEGKGREEIIDELRMAIPRKYWTKVA